MAVAFRGGPISARSIMGRSLALAALFLAVLGVAKAGAVDYSFSRVGQFADGPGSAQGEFDGLRRLAVEDSTHRIFAIDSGNDRVEVFAPSGLSASFVTEFGAAALDEPFGIAIDQATGDVYVSSAGNDRIVKFNSDGAPIPTYTVDATFASPNQGTGVAQIGSFEADLDIDPASGDLVVADPGDDALKRFQSDGTFVSSFDGAGSPDGAFNQLLSVAAGSGGDMYTVDTRTLPMYTEGGGCGSIYCRNTEARVERFDAAGVYQSTLVPFSELESYSDVEFDLAHSQVLLLDEMPGGQIDVRTPAGVELASVAPYFELGGFPAGYGPHTGIAVDGSSGAMYLAEDEIFNIANSATYGQVAIHTFEALAFPDVTIAAPSSVTDSEATFSGSVNPHGSAATWQFEYRRDADSTWSSVPSSPQSAGSGSSPVPVQATVESLQPSTAYHVRLVASSGSTTKVTSSEEVFTTDAVAPVAMTAYAAPRTTTTARLSGYVNPHNDSTRFFFEWGTDNSYGNSVPVSEDADAGSGGQMAVVAETLAGLQPDTTYHYRLVAVNSAGRSEGADHLLHTRSNAEQGPPSRGIELVNAPDKGNQNAGAAAPPTADGNRVLWSTFGSGPGTPTGTGGVFLAERTASGWHSRSALPPVDRLVGGGDRYYNLKQSSTSLDRYVWQIREGLLSNVEVGLAESDLDGNQKVFRERFPLVQELWLDATEDLSHVFGTTNVQIDPNAPSGVYNVYDFSANPPELVSKLASGNAPACGVEATNDHSGFAGNGPKTHWTSADGMKVFFETREDNCSAEESLYLRDRVAGTTALISGPPLTGPDRGGFLLRTNASASVAVFASESVLDPSDTNTTMDLYRYVEGLGNECLTCVVPDADVDVTRRHGRDEEVVVSEDLSHIYFRSPNQLTPEAGSGGALYLLHDGVVQLVARKATAGVASASRDGTEALISGNSLTADPASSGFSNLYVFRAADGSLECLDCVRSGPNLGSRGGEMNADGGDVVFTTRNRLLPVDINGGADVYEWRNGQLRLITDGEVEWPNLNGRLEIPRTGAITPDGGTVLFTGGGVALTGYERDDVGQLYAARVGGGFPPPAAPAAPCDGDDCQGPLDAAPPTQAPGSLSVSGPGNQREARKQGKARRCRKGRKAVKAKGRVRCKRVAKKRRATKHHRRYRTAKHSNGGRK